MSQEENVLSNAIIFVAHVSSWSTSREDIINLISENGGLAVENINARVSHVLIGEKQAKATKQKAEEFNLPVITETTLRSHITQGKQLPSKATRKRKAEVNTNQTKKRARVAQSKSRVTRKSRATKSKAAADDDDYAVVATNSRMVKVVKAKNARAAVDARCRLSGVHVYEEGDDVFASTLNQTRIGTNANKFYLVQLLQEDGGGRYWVWTRWGRIGANGQTKVLPTPSGTTNLESAKAVFKKKFQEKSGNKWENRANFVAKAGKYTMIDIDYNDDEDEDDELEKKELRSEVTKAEIPDSTLHPSLQDLLKMIFNINMMQDTLVEMEFDIKKMPLGKLKKSTIAKAYEVCKKIEKILKGNIVSDDEDEDEDEENEKEEEDEEEFVPNKRKKRVKSVKPTLQMKYNLEELSNQFYSYIPHNYGRSRPPIINTTNLLKSKLAMLEALGDIEIATKILKSSNKLANENPIDQHYKALNTKMTVLDKEGDEFQLIKRYVDSTHGPTHDWYTLEIEDVFKLKRPIEEENFYETSEEIDNHQLLWHGSRLTNFVGILSQGLRIAPPEAPVTGYMFGKGLYFADMVTKSANYCHATDANPIGLLILSRVALGKMKKLKQAKYMDKPPKSFDSTMGVGRFGPNPDDTHYTDEGVAVPCGKAKDLKVKNTSLQYNEFIVYDTAQALMQYVLKVRFNFTQ